MALERAVAHVEADPAGAVAASPREVAANQASASRGTTMGAVIREAIKQHASALMDDPSWIDEVEDLQRRLEPLLPPRR